MAVIEIGTRVVIPGLNGTVVQIDPSSPNGKAVGVYLDGQDPSSKDCAWYDPYELTIQKKYRWAYDYPILSCPQIRDAAVQYHTATARLDCMPPGSGMLLPLIMCASFSIELFLKSVNSIKLEPEIGLCEPYIVTEAALHESHNLRVLFDKIRDNEVKKTLNHAFSTFPARSELSLREMLENHANDFVNYRYNFENKNSKVLKLSELVDLSDFFYLVTTH